MNFSRWVLLAGLFLFPAFAGKAENGNDPIPAYQVIGNIYYVGADDITSYLITSPQGHIILNSGYESTVPIIRDGVRALGFKLEDVKILLNSQAHFDHVAGLRDLQKLTGAKVYSSEREVAVLESGGARDPRFGKDHRYPAVHVDHAVKDGEQVQLGGLVLTAHLTPGHSQGCTTWTMVVSDGGRKYDVVFVGGTAVNPGVRLINNPTWPGIKDDYEKTFQVLHSLKCDVFLGAHGGYYGMREKLKRAQTAKENPFIDPQGYRAFIDSEEQQVRKQMASEK